MKFIYAIDNFIHRIINMILVLLFGVMLSLAVMQVLLRYFFNNGILWGDVAARTLVIWVGFLGAALATREEKHFRLDIVTRYMGKNYQRWFFGFSDLFAAVICFFLGQASITFVGLDSQSKTFLDIPLIAVEIIVPAGFFIMMIQFVLRMLMQIVDGERISADRKGGM